MPLNQSDRIRTLSIISVSTPRAFSLSRSQRRSPSIRSIAIAPSRVASSAAWLVKVPRGDEQAFVGAPLQRPAKIPDILGTDAPLPTLALEVDLKRYKVDA